MLLLIAFGLVAGAGTAVTPCVLPVLPALLSAGATGGRRRPVGIAVGLVVTFTITIVGLAKLVSGVGLGSGPLRDLAILALLAFGVALVVPAVGDRLEARLSRLGRFGPRSRGHGLWSGLGVGAALGFVVAPCAGPILAAVISVSAAQGPSGGLVPIALAYATGLSAVLALYCVGGRRVADRIRRVGRGPALQRALGVVLMLTAVVMAAELDVRFQTALAAHVPRWLVNPTESLERSEAVERRLVAVRGRSRFQARPEAAASGLPRLGAAPDFADVHRWLNTDGRALSLGGLRGRVVLLDFWTYTCINCIRTLPFVRGLDERYRDAGLTVVGVHTPEFEFEKRTANVASAIRRHRLGYPVAQDNDFGTWNAWSNQFWPAKYLVDAQGQVRYVHFGEGSEAETEAAVRALLAERDARPLPVAGVEPGERPSGQAATPETYLGSLRAERFLPRPLTDGVRRYPGVAGRLPLSHFALRGAWKVDPESATSEKDASLDASFQAAKVFLVLSSRDDRPRRVSVSLDGRRASPDEAGRDGPGGTVTVRGQRLYELVSLPRAERRRLTLRFEPGVSAYAFTFG